jgi:hypothetical protein
MGIEMTETEKRLREALEQIAKERGEWRSELILHDGRYWRTKASQIAEAALAS